MEVISRLGLGLLFSASVAVFALRRGSLSPSGAVAALIIGSTIYVGGGAPWFLTLLTFFLTSTLLGKVGRARKAQVKLEFEKGDRRDAKQAFSNGGVAALCALGMALWPAQTWACAFLGALATANGDTWATELGVLSRKAPWSLVTLRTVPRGTSGAVSPLGMLATLLGGLAIGGCAALTPTSFGLDVLTLLTLGGSMGVLGSLWDSLLGATVQARFHCPACQRTSEGERHHCGTLCRPKAGLRWFNNDLVNLAATSAGALLGASFSRLL